MNPLRVLVVDDSAFARKVVREILLAAGMEVVGIARDGAEALEQIVALSPDVVTLDLMMPGIDGLGVLRALPVGGIAPNVVIVSTADEDTELGVEALRAGAFDLVHKPSALAVSRLYEIGKELVDKVRAAGGPHRPTRPLADVPVEKVEATSDKLVVIGTSTGGPQALGRLLRSLPAKFPAPIAIALHIPAGYTESLARRLDGECAIEVVEASDGLSLGPGRAVLARAGYHLRCHREKDGREKVLVDRQPTSTLYVPSVDVLFESAAETWGASTIGVVLTGMGDDGTLGAQAIKARGGTILTEAESSCVVYGMPRSIVERGLSDEEVPLGEMGQAIARRL